MKDRGRRAGEPPAVVPVALLREAITRFGRVEVRALGSSMAPVIPSGSRCEIRATPPSAVRVHDIVALAHGETLVIHRVIALGPRGFLLAGDNARSADPWAGGEALLGRVDRIVLPSGASRDVSGPIWSRLAWPLRLLGFIRRRGP